MAVCNDGFMDDALFDMEAPAPVSLADRFVVPPFSILDRRSGDWQDRKRKWLSMGIKSEEGRADKLTFSFADTDFGREMAERVGETSVFDPVVCELVYRWFTKPGAKVLDPFCGGSVRGVVASTLARWYYGVDIRPEQVDANKAQLNICSDIEPKWLVGDATNLEDTFGGDEFDLVFSCPPYADLEVYSDHPRDISAWGYDEFVAGHAKAIKDACAMLRPNRYAAWVIGDVRDKKGRYLGLHHETVEAFKAAGLQVINECVVVDPVGTAAVRSGRPFEANRKITLTHQHLLVFVKGDVRAAADWATSPEVVDDLGGAL
jgi:DNA modification methylase